MESTKKAKYLRYPASVELVVIALLGALLMVLAIPLITTDGNAGTNAPQSAQRVSQ